MSHYTKQDIIRMVEEEDVEFIRLQFTDILGTLKNVAITKSQLERALNNECMFDGSSIEGFVRIEESDMYLHPDLDTFATFPWRPQTGKVARIICDVYSPDGKPFEGDPRFVYRKVLDRAKEMGYSFEVGSECEFFLFHLDEEGAPTTVTHEKASYFDLGPIDLGENARRDMVLALEEMGYGVEASHHEVAPGQHEIDARYEEGLAAADYIMTFKLAIKSIAKRHGLFASFMPKPRAGENGSGMHINMSLSKNGKNIFTDENDALGLSKEAYWFIGGLMKHAKAMTAITNPLVNSYKRLIPGFEAPVHVAWSAKSRNQMIRIPSGRGESTRIELRSPDPSMNPYLALAVCLAAGLDGIENHIMPPRSVEEEAEVMQNDRLLPRDLKEALTELEKDDYMKEVLGAHVSEKFIEAKRADWEAYCSAVTSWEIEEYLYKI